MPTRTEGRRAVKPAPVQVLSRADKIIKFVHKYILVPEGMLVGQQMKLEPEQIDFIRAVYDNVDSTGTLITRRGIFSLPRKNGKALALDTPIPTPKGWRTMGDIHVGDRVFGKDGRAVRVLAESEVFVGKRCYRVEFSDGSFVVASEDHIWVTRCSYRPWEGVPFGWREVTTRVTTAQITGTLMRPGDRVAYNHKIELAAGSIVSITGCERVRSVPTKCITVDAQDHLFLAGHGCIPTHNSGLIAALLGAHIIGPEATQNAQLYSAARSREQASVVFKYLAKSLRMMKKLEGLVNITDSGKRILGLAAGTEYHALSADATTAYGLSPRFAIHDELGQVVGPTDELYDAIETAGGAHEEPLTLVISTQAAGDTDLLSILIDDAIRNPSPDTVLRLFAAGKEDNIWDEKTWYKANFALGKFRSYKEFKGLAERAKRMPSFEAAFRNLYLNMRISRLSLLVTPSLWRECNGIPKLELFYKYPVALAFDLSQSMDLTACVASVQDPDDGRIHCLPFVFTPLDTLEQRQKTDRAPYQTWVDNGQLIALPGKSVDYDMVAEYMKGALDGMRINVVAFDRWRIDNFKKSCEHVQFLQAKDIIWQPCGQGYRDMTLRVEEFEKLLLSAGMLHGGHPLLNMGAANCVLAKDPANNKKPEKHLSSARIDPLVAQLMSVYACLYPAVDDKPAKPQVTEQSLFFV